MCKAKPSSSQIQSRRGHPFDFDNAADQDTLLGGLWNRIVKFQERYFRHAVKIDDDDAGDDGLSLGASISRTLQAVATSDPAVLLQYEQDAIELTEKAADSYSEAVAYVILLRRHDDDKGRLANYLRIAIYTLGERLRRAAAAVRVQPSIFDGVERIPEDFHAKIERQKPQHQRAELQGEQGTWSF